MMLVRLSVRSRIFETNETSEVQFLNEFSSLLETFYDSAVSDGYIQKQGEFGVE